MRSRRYAMAVRPTCTASARGAARGQVPITIERIQAVGERVPLLANCSAGLVCEAACSDRLLPVVRRAAERGLCMATQTGPAVAGLNLADVHAGTAAAQEIVFRVDPIAPAHITQRPQRQPAPEALPCRASAREGSFSRHPRVFESEADTMAAIRAERCSGNVIWC